MRALSAAPGRYLMPSLAASSTDVGGVLPLTGGVGRHHQSEGLRPGFGVAMNLATEAAPLGKDKLSMGHLRPQSFFEIGRDWPAFRPTRRGREVNSMLTF